jgi:hypothetical protein
MSLMKSTRRYVPRWFLWMIIAIITGLVILRLCLPYIIINYVTKQVNKIPEYRVKIPDLDVHLWRGSYTIKDLQLWKMKNSIPVPFYKAELMDLSVEWAALFHGVLVAKIVAQRPVINFVADEKGGNEQLGIPGSWLEIVKTLFPLRFNRIEAVDGEVNFRSYTSDPPFKIFLNKLQLVFDNIQNADHSSKLLYSTFKMRADSNSAGTLDIEGKFNPLITQPTFFINAALKGMSIADLKSFLKSYTKVDVQSGTFSVYGEAAAADGRIKGTVKPFLKNLRIAPDKNSSPLQAVVDTAAAVVAKIIKNQKHDTIATKINIEGNVNDPNESILSIIGYMLRHAFIQALLPQIDHNIKMQDVLIGVQGSAASSNTRDNKRVEKTSHSTSKSSTSKRH